MERGVGHICGGIAGLLRLIDEHEGALEYDLMYRAGLTLDDVPARVSWRALRNFAAHLDVESATAKELSPEFDTWNRADRVPAMLADIFDAINDLRWAFECANTPKRRKRPKRPPRYPRPGADRPDAKRIGSDPIPIRDFDEWWEGGDGLWREDRS